MASNNQTSIGTFDFYAELEKIGAGQETTSEEDYQTAGEDSPDEANQYTFTEEMALPPPVPKKIKNSEIKTLLGPALVPRLGIMFPIEAVVRDSKDPDYKAGSLKEEVRFTTQKLTFRHFRKDGTSFVAYKLALDGEYKDVYKEEFMEALSKSNQYLGSMGTLHGLLHRLTSGLLKVPSVRPFDVEEQIMFAKSVLHYYAVDVNYIGKNLQEVMKDDRARSKFNGKSSLGVPYGSRKYKNSKTGEIDREVIALVYENASLILKRIAAGKFASLYAKRPALFLVLLKNKQDFYKIDELDVKTRPYFVYPAHERLLYQALQTPLKPVLFDEEASSHRTNSSAVGFVWNYGGGDRLYNWIASYDNADVQFEFRSIFYGDDQLWVIRLKTGEKYVLTPDFSHMDLSLVKQWFKVAYGLWHPQYTAIDKTWSDVLLLNCRRCFSKTILVESSLAYSLEKGVGSGIPGTTKFDEVASASVNGFIRHHFSKVGDGITSDNLRRYLDATARAVSEKYGLTFKEGTLEPYLFMPGQPSYEFEFLGQTLQRVVGGDELTTHYVPKPKLHRLLLTATTTRKAYASVNIMERSFQTIRRSLVANGGYLYPMFYEATKTLYERKLDKFNLRPLDMEEEEYEYEVEEEKFFEPLPFDADDYSFPSVMSCANLFLPHHNQLKADNRSMDEHLGQQLLVPTKIPKMPLTLDSDDEGDESDAASTPRRTPPRKEKRRGPNPISETFDQVAEEVGRDWGKSSAVERDMFDDIGGVTVPTKTRVPVESQELRQPLPQAQKDAFNNELKDQAAARKMARQNMFDKSKAGSSSSKQKKGRRSTHAVVIDFDDPENFLTDTDRATEDDEFYDAA